MRQTERLMCEAIETHLAGLLEDGEPIPTPTTIARMYIPPAQTRLSVTARMRLEFGS